MLRSVDGLVSPAVAETLKALKLADEDAAVARLVRRYAAAIDEAASTAADLAKVRSADSGVQAQVRALAAKVDAQDVLAKLGPKLLDGLEALGATPRARSAGKGVIGDPVGRGKLAQIRSARSA